MSGGQAAVEDHMFAPSNQVFLGNLPRRTSPRDIEAIFSSIGVLPLRITLCQRSPTLLKYCFVLVQNEKAACACVEAFQCLKINGAEIKVTYQGVIL